MILLFAMVARADDPIRALFITEEPAATESRVEIITSGISRRSAVDIKWEILQFAEVDSEEFPTTFDDTIESGSFDTVIYDLSPPSEERENWTERILAPHRDGTPAVILGGGLTLTGEVAAWSEFCGAIVKTESTGPDRELGVAISRANHPITHLLEDWITPMDSPVMIENLVERPTRLASVDGTPACWTHLYGERNARVFAIAFGESAESVAHPSFLTLLTRGFLWSVSRSIAPNLRSDPSMPDPVTRFRPGNNLVQSHFQAAFSSSRDPEFACDGDPTTAWTADPNDLINWWQVNLNQTVHPRVIMIHRDISRPHPWLVETSSDGNAWEPIIRLEDSTSPVTLHEVDTRLSRIRITNSITGSLEGLFELSAYESMAQVPSHLAALAHRPPSMVPEKEEAPAGEPPSPPAKYEMETVSILIDRIENSRNGSDRHEWILTLADLYRKPGGKTWQGSDSIATFLEKCFYRKNFNRRLILSVIIRENIQIRDLSRILRSTHGDSRLRFHRIRLMEHSGVPEGQLGFLTRVMKDSNETLGLRLRVARLLAESSDMKAMRDSLEWYGSLSAEDLVHLEVQKDALQSAMFSNPTWEAQLEWILSTAQSAEAEPHRILAWEVIIHLLIDSDSRPSSIDRIGTFMDDLIDEESKASGKTSLPLFVTTSKALFDQAIIREWLDRFTSELPGSDLANLVTSTKQEIMEARLVGNLTSESLNTFLSESGRGDIKKGKALYARTCFHCHERKAPSLDEKEPDFLDNLLHPDKSITRETHTWKHHMVDGSTYKGFEAQEEATWYEVVDSAGNSIFLDKAEIVTRARREGSTMPQDLVENMTVGDLADLLAYLESL